jgi:hypothetical protein
MFQDFIFFLNLMLDWFTVNTLFIKVIEITSRSSLFSMARGPGYLSKVIVCKEICRLKGQVTILQLHQFQDLALRKL